MLSQDIDVNRDLQCSLHTGSWRIARRIGAILGLCFACAILLGCVVTLPSQAKAVVRKVRSDRHVADQTNTTTVSPVPISPTTELVTAARGLYRWFDAEQAPVSAPALDEYKRFNWNQMETGQGQYNFALIEAEAVSAHLKGHKFSFRIMPVWSGKGVCVPAYLAAMMPGGYTSYAADGKTPYTYVPDWNSTAYLTAAANLVAALAKKYDGDPRIGYIDIGLYGSWGEWNTGYGFSPQPAKLPIATSATKHAIVDMHLNSFIKTQLIMMTDDADSVTYAMGQSATVGLRRDSLGEAWFANGLTGQGAADWNAIQNRWKTAPFITEIVGSSTAAEDFVLGAQQVQTYHVAAVANGNFCAAVPYGSLSQTQQSAFLTMGLNSGYRFTLQTASFQTFATAGSPFQIEATWINTGCTPAYNAWDVTYSLIAADGTTAWSGISVLDLRKLLPSTAGTIINDAILFDEDTPSGTYTLFVTVVDHAAYYSPIVLAIQGRTSNGSYALGSVTVQ